MQLLKFLTRKYSHLVINITIYSMFTVLFSSLDRTLIAVGVKIHSKVSLINFPEQRVVYFLITKILL